MIPIELHYTDRCFSDSEHIWAALIKHPCCLRDTPQVTYTFSILKAAVCLVRFSILKAAVCLVRPKSFLHR